MSKDEHESSSKTTKQYARLYIHLLKIEIKVLRQFYAMLN